MTAKAHLNLSDVPGFINQCFNPNIRSTAAVVNAMTNGEMYHTFVDDASATLILRSWLAVWQQTAGDTFNAHDAANCTAWDRPMLQFFATSYFKSAQNLQLCRPNLSYKGMQDNSSKAIYNGHGYKSTPFFDAAGHFNYGSFSDAGLPTGNAPTVALFLRSLFLGGHHVFVSSTDDTKQSITNAYSAFCAAPLVRTHDPKNSHYTTSFWGGTPTSWNGTGEYFEHIIDDQTPANAGLILALLFGETSNKHTNTFMQLEGWPYGGNSERHGADYDAYKDTLWNFGTYAACVWSEKRCTPIFVAPSDFSLQVNKKTHMPLYNGAGSKQNWMDTDLLDID